MRLSELRRRIRFAFRLLFVRGPLVEWMILALAESMVEYGDEIGAVNYIEFPCENRRRPDRSPVIIAKFRNGKTPHELKEEAKARARAWKACARRWRQKAMEAAK